MSACSNLTNPETPLAFLKKAAADQYEISRHLYMATLGAFIWDILTTLPEEYRLLFKHRIALPTVVYFTSRISSLAYIITSTVFQVATVHDCQKLQVALGWCFCVAVSSTSFLFFLRVRAILERRKFVVVLFFTIWLAVVGGTMTVPFSIQGNHIGTTQYCINTSVKPAASIGIIISSVNDALVFTAISWRIVSAMTIDESLRGRLDIFLGKGSLPALSKAVLQGGQQYYFVTVGSNLLTLVMILVPSVPPVYHAMFTVPNVGLMNSMACRVYRHIKFGIIQAVPTTVQSNIGKTMFDTSFRRNGGPSDDGGFSTRTPRGNGGVQVTKITEQLHDNMPMEVILSGAKSHYGLQA